MTKETIVKMYWTCRNCGTGSIDGLVDECPNCGDRKPSDIQYEFSEIDVEVTEEELKAAGISKEECDGEHKEWVCNYCGRLNNWADTICVGCSSVKEEATHEYGMDEIEEDLIEKEKENPSFIASQGTGMSRYFASPNLLDKKNEIEKLSRTGTGMTRAFLIPNLEGKISFPDSENFSAVEYPANISVSDSIKAKKNTSNKMNSFWNDYLKPILSTIAPFVGIFLLFAILLWPVKEETYVSDFYWERNIYIEELQTFKESGWSIPSGARVYEEKYEFRRYDQVIDHYETKLVQKSRTVQDGYTTNVSYRDNGNGTATKIETKTPKYKTEYYAETVKEPVYKQVEVWDTKYYYEIDRWVNVRNSNASGNNQIPYWNEEYILQDKERDITRNESYQVLYDNGAVEYLPYEEWKEVELGDGYLVTKSKLLGIVYSSEEITK